MSYQFQRGRGGGGRGGVSRGNYNNNYVKKHFEDLPNEAQVTSLNYMIECLKNLITPKGRRFVNDGHISWANDPFTQFTLAKLNEKLRKQKLSTYDNNGFITNEIYHYPGKIHTTHTFFKTMSEFGLLDLIRCSDDEYVLIKPHDNAFDIIESKIARCTRQSGGAAGAAGGAGGAGGAAGGGAAGSAKTADLISSDEDDDDA